MNKESTTDEKRFEFLHTHLRTSTETNLWIEYSQLVKDSMAVLEHMLKFVSKQDQIKVYYEMALQFEC